MSVSHKCSFTAATKATAIKLSVILSTKFNSAVKVTPEQVKAAQEIISQANEAMDTVLPYIQGVLKSTGLKPSCAVQEGPCKLLERLIAKAIEKHDGDVTKVPDPHRLRILVDSADEIETLREFYVGLSPQYYANFDDNKGQARLAMISDPHPHNHIRCNEFEDYFYVPSSTGRVAIHVGLTVRVPGKKEVPFEIQILHKDMLDAEAFSRDNYVNAQELGRKIKLAIDKGTPSDDPKILQYERGIEAYNQSSKERYLADSIHHDVIKLRRIDLQRQVKPDVLARQLDNDMASNDAEITKAPALVWSKLSNA